MRGGKAKTKRTRTKRVARSAMGSLMSPVDITSPNLLGALEKRVKSGPLTLVLVYADWCGHCNRFKPMMKELETLSNRSIQMARVRDDMYPKTALAAKNKVEGYPSLLLVDSAGNAMKFKQPSGEVNINVPDHTNMSKMTALVRSAGTPEGINLLNSVNKNLTGKPLALPSGVTETNKNLNSLNTVNTANGNSLNSAVVVNSAISTATVNNRNNRTSKNKNRNRNVNESISGNANIETENVTNLNSGMEFESTSAETVPFPSSNSVATEPSAVAKSAPQNIVADRLTSTNILNQNATLANSQNRTVRGLTQRGGSMSGSENFCGSSCTVPHSQNGGAVGGGGLLGALSAAATNLAPAAALFLAAEAVAGRKGKKGRKSRKQLGGGCGCGLTRRNNRG
jgi:thiol-disulfide isomerase/thioredoxin